MKNASPMEQSGIYEIVNIENGKRYIGSAARFSARWWIHKKYLRKGMHHSSILQKAWNRYGESGFVLRILEIVEDRSQLLNREQHYLDTLNPEYNIARIAGSRQGLSNTEESNARRKATLSSPEVRAHLSEVRKGIPRTEEWRANQSRAMLGNKNFANRSVYSKNPDETRAKQSAAKKGKPSNRVWTDAERAAMAESRSGFKYSAESRAKMSASAKARGATVPSRFSDEQKARASEMRKGGAALREIAAFLGCGISHAHRLCGGAD